MLYDCKRISYWIDRRLTDLAGPDHDAPISFGLPLEPEDSQYGKSRLYSLAACKRRSCDRGRCGAPGLAGKPPPHPSPWRVKHPWHQWHMEGEDDTNKRIAAFNGYCRIASWDKPWQISRAMEVAAPSSSKMLRACSTISTDGWSPAISSCSA